jgi:hypothetical protein
MPYTRLCNNHWYAGISMFIIIIITYSRCPICCGAGGNKPVRGEPCRLWREEAARTDGRSMAKDATWHARL